MGIMDIVDMFVICLFGIGSLCMAVCCIGFICYLKSGDV